MALTQRDRLIDAMARTVASKGFGVPLTDVCTAAGVSTRAFYEHFADKEACFMAAFEGGASFLMRAVTAAYTQPDRWPVRIRRGLEVMMHLLAAEPAFARLAMVESFSAGPRARERMRQIVDEFRVFLDDAPRRPDQPPVPAIVGEAIVAGVFGLLFNYVSARRAAELPSVVSDVTYFVLVPFIGTRAALAVAGLPSMPLPPLHAT